MKNLISVIAGFLLLFGCEKSTDKLSSYYIAKIVGFDLNCSTCILEFPDDSLEIKGVLGLSPDNYYQAINLSKGNYEIGQKLKVNIRKAEISELTPCITLYPSYNYKNVSITDFENFNNLIFNDTIDLPYQDCLYDSENRIYICFDSIKNDSRCPPDVQCIWEGNAEVRLKFEKLNNKPIFFNLNTNQQFRKDTIVDGFKVSLVGLSCYPAREKQTTQKSCAAKIIVEKN
jgi:hypothetical protein